MADGPASRPSTGASLVVTFASIAAAALGNVAAYKVVALLGDPVLLSDYSVDRRYLAFLIPVLALGGGVAIPLRIAIRPVMEESLRILYLQLVAAAGVALLLLALLATPGDPLGSRLPDDTLRLAAIVVMAYASNCTAMLYGFQRGLMRFREGAWLLVLANGVFPAVAAVAVVHSVELTFLIWAACSGVLAVVMLGRLPRPTRGSIPNLGSLVRSGLGRVPGDLAYAALFLLPVSEYAAADAPTREAVFNYFFVMLGVLTAAASPIAIVMLPLIGARVATHGRAAARRVVLANFIVAVSCGLVVFGALRWVAGPLLTLLLSREYAGDADLLSALAPAALGVALFVFLRTTVDGLGERPLVAGICVVALAVFVGLRLATTGWSLESSLVLSTNVSLGMLGLVTASVSLVMFTRPSAVDPG
ncbi:hypothetical protein GCM10009795_024110 [Nocardioides hankookensis]|uniref:Polysaccharide biosynthesis protein n=1 Tax=Nocardioides hankookensis TaxID=443157 RepID=A0ABW1LDP9_9ACTN